MENVSKTKRNKMLNFLNELKKSHTDDASLVALNEIQAALTEKKYGLVFEEHNEEIDEILMDYIPIFSENKEKNLLW